MKMINVTITLRNEEEFEAAVYTDRELIELLYAMAEFFSEEMFDAATVIYPTGIVAVYTYSDITTFMLPY